MSDSIIDISGLDRAAVLAALFNASAPSGLGFLQAANGPQIMTVEDARSIIEKQNGDMYFDYVLGRPLKADLRRDEFYPGSFDRDNGGEGTAKRVIDHLRATGEVNSSATKEHRKDLFQKRVETSKEMLPAGFVEKIAGAISLIAEVEEDGIPDVPEGMTPRQHLDWASDQALVYYDHGSPAKAFLLFGILVSKNVDTAWIASSSITPMLLHTGAAEGRSRLEYMMKGFAVSDVASV